MKQKTHSGLKKRVRVKKSGTVMVQKGCKNHLLSNKSKRQKKALSAGKAVDPSRMKALRRLLPGAGRRQKAARLVAGVAEKSVAKTVKPAGAGKAPASRELKAESK